MTWDAPREAAIHRLPPGYRVLTPEESMEIELRLLREMAERYGALMEREKRDRRDRECTDAISAERSLNVHI